MLQEKHRARPWREEGREEGEGKGASRLGWKCRMNEVNFSCYIAGVRDILLQTQSNFEWHVHCTINGGLQTLCDI